MTTVAIISWLILPIRDKYSIPAPIMAQPIPKVISRFSNKFQKIRDICIFIGINYSAWPAGELI
jgi:hypothetical protein